MAGLVLDLRNNPGGLLDQSVAIADAFLDNGLIVKIRGRQAASERGFPAEPGDLVAGLPIVVLINAGSASAAEIVAAALGDNGRATVMGSTSFGKGSVQTIMRLPEGGALKLTTALYYSPSRSDQARGITPRIQLLPAKDKDAEQEPHEVDLPGALPARDPVRQMAETSVDTQMCPPSGQPRTVRSAVRWPTSRPVRPIASLPPSRRSRAYDCRPHRRLPPAGRWRLKGWLRVSPAQRCSPPAEVTRLNFQALWKNTPVGSYSFVITPSADGSGMTVSHAFLIRVKIAFVTMFRYEHRVEEVWRAGRLHELSAETIDADGTIHVRAQRTGGDRDRGPNGGATALHSSHHHVRLASRLHRSEPCP